MSTSSAVISATQAPPWWIDNDQVGSSRPVVRSRNASVSAFTQLPCVPSRFCFSAAVAADADSTAATCAKFCRKPPCKQIPHRQTDPKPDRLVDPL